MVYNTEKLLRENREKISASDAQEIEAALAETKQAIDAGKGAAEIDRAVERLTKATHHMAETLYQQAAAPGGAGSAPPSSSATEEPGGKKEGEVIDAEYVDVDEKKDRP